MNYRPSHPVERFVRYLVYFLAFRAFFSLIFQVSYDVGQWILPAALLSIVFTIYNRPVEKHWLYRRGYNSFRDSLKEILIKRFDVADQTDSYIYFRPTLLWSLIYEPVFVHFDMDGASVEGSASWLKYVERKLDEYVEILPRR